MLPDNEIAHSSIPPNITEITINCARLPILPRGLKSLYVQSLRMDKAEKLKLTQSPKPLFPGLTSLHFEHFFPTELFGLLPSSLQYLHLPASQDTLEALKLHSGQLPLLAQLTLRLPSSEPANNTIEISMATIPTSITKLHVFRPYRFSTSPDRYLQHHPSLTSAKFLNTAVRVLHVFRNLPSQIVNVEAIFRLTSFNIANTDLIAEIYAHGRRLTSMRDLRLQQDDSFETFEFKWPRDRRTWPFIGSVLLLPDDLRRAYWRAFIASWKSPKYATTVVSEIILFACLPRGLSNLVTPVVDFRPTRRTNAGYGPITLSLFWSTLKYQFPLLGYALFDESDYQETRTDETGEIIASLPPKLSMARINTRSYLESEIFRANTGFLPLDLYNDNKSTKPWISSSEATYHGINALSLFLWLELAPESFGPFLLCCLTGSLMALPRSISQWKNSGKSSSQQSKLPLPRSVGAIGFWTLFVNILTFALLSSQGWLAVCYGFALILGSVARNMIVYNSRK